MDAVTRTYLWEQFGGAIDMLDDALTLCPDSLWTAHLWDDEEDQRFGDYWFIAFHASRWLDVYVSGAASAGECPLPSPFVAGLPSQPYSRESVRAYLQATRTKVRAAMSSLTSERAHSPATWGAPYLRLQLMSMRHTQEHASQLTFFLGQQGVTGMDWVAEARA